MRPYRNDFYYDLLFKLVSNLTGALGGGTGLEEPAGESASVIDDDSVLITWEDTSNGEDGFTVGLDLEENLDDGEEPGIVVTVPPDQEQVTIDNLEPGQTYFYTVQPFNAEHGNGPKTTPKPFTMTGVLDDDSLDDFTGATDGATSRVKTGTGWKGNGDIIVYGYIETNHSIDTLTLQSNGTVTSITSYDDPYDFAGNSGSFTPSNYVEFDNSLDDLDEMSNGTVTSITSYETPYNFASLGSFTPSLHVESNNSIDDFDEMSDGTVTSITSVEPGWSFGGNGSFVT